MTPVEILKAARAKIEDPERWTTGMYARNREGLPIPSNDRVACKWCAHGAMMAVTDDDDPDYYKAINALSNVCGGSPANFNDSHTHAEVLDAFDQAIDALS
jgi:hypothetical protein